MSVTGTSGCPVANQTVKTEISATGKKRIKVEPKEQTTGSDGTATFTISAKNKTGKATLKFVVKGVDAPAKVKVTVVK